MKKYLRILVLSLAMLLCVLPLTACDAGGERYDAPVQVAKFPSHDNSMYVLYQQLGNPDDKGRCEMVLGLYNADGTLLDSVEVTYKGDGEPTPLDLEKVKWNTDGTVTVTYLGKDQVLKFK